MRSLRKTLALFLAVIVFIGVSTVGTSARVYKDSEEINYNMAVQALSALGVMNGELNSDGTYSLRPGDPITRAEFCKLVYMVINGGNAPVLGELSNYSFSDIKNHWAAACIESLAVLGVTAGYGDGTFGPDNYITGQQAAKILLVISGYDASVERLIGPQWAYRTDALANMSDFYEGLLPGFKTSDLLKREEAAQLVWNAMRGNMVYYRSVSSGGAVRLIASKSATNLLEYYFDGISITAGVLSINAYGDVRNSSGFSADSGITGWDGSLTWVKSPSDAALLGQSVMVFRKTENKFGMITQTVLGDIFATDYNKLYVTAEAGEITAAAAGMTIAGADILINYNKTSAAGTVFTNGRGWKTTFIDNNGDGRAEFVSTYVTTPYKVKSVDENGSAILTNLVTNLDLPGAYKDFFSEDGEPIGVVKDQILLAAVCGGRVFAAKYSVVTGEIEKIKVSRDGTSLTIDGSAYYLHDSSAVGDGSGVMNLGCVRIGAKDLIFYIDGMGNIFYAAASSDAVAVMPEFAVATEAGTYSLLHNGQPLRVTFADGTTKVIIASKLYSSGGFNPVSSSNLLDLSGGARLIACARHQDGTYEVYPTAVTPNTTFKGVVSGSPRILGEAETFVPNYFADSFTEYIDVVGGKAYRGYASVPSMTFTQSFVLTDEYGAEVYNIFNPGASESGYGNLIDKLFIMDAEITPIKFTASDNFLIRDVGSYTEKYVGSLVCRVYKAIISGEEGEVILPADNGLESGTLYMATAYNADGVIIESIPVTDFSTAAEVTYAGNGTLVCGSDILATNSSTKYIDVASGQTVSGVRAGDKVYVYSYGITALQVYICNNL